jgi:UPF0176 protein
MFISSAIMVSFYFGGYNFPFAAELYDLMGLQEGRLYVFDGRMGMDFSDHTKTIGTCIHCSKPTSNYENCAEPSCNELVLICDDCKKDKSKLFHSERCREVSVRASSK